MVSFAIVVAVIVIVSSMYFLYVRQPEITVTVGTASHTFTGDFLKTNSGNYTRIAFGAVTQISEKSSSGFFLNTYMMGGPFGTESVTASGIAYNLSFVSVLNITGRLPYNLHPTGIVISAEPINGSSQTFMTYSVSEISIFYLSKYLHNVSEPAQPTGLPVRFGLNNDNGLNNGQIYNFSMTIGLDMFIPYGLHIQANATNGISVTVTLEGLSEPVSTTLYLFFISTS